MVKTSSAVKFDNGNISILDQTLLPVEEKWLEITKTSEMTDAIKELKVRGAPAIGVSAAMMIAKLCLENASYDEIVFAAKTLRKSRPTAVNLMWAMDKLVLNVLESSWTRESCLKAAYDIFDNDVKICDDMATLMQDYINDGDSIITHCNTGGLATVGVGTALGGIIKAHQLGKKIHLYIDETRPLLQGGRLTTWECQKHSIPHTLICDNMAATLMAAKKINKAFVGADRVAQNGDFANKIGTYSLAVLCKYHQVDFFAVAPYSTIDPDCPSGNQIPIELRDQIEVKGVNFSFGKISWANESTNVFNPAFDVTPSELLTKFIFNHGVFGPDELQAKKHLNY